MNWYKTSQINPFVLPILDMMKQPPSNPMEIQSRLGMSGPVPMPDEVTQINQAIDYLANNIGLDPAQMDLIQSIRDMLTQNQDEGTGDDIQI